MTATARRLSIALLLALAADGYAAEPCPVLPADSGLAWRVERGIDSVACYAHPPDEYNAWFGLSFGQHPEFTRRPGANDEAGLVGGRAVTWQPATGKDGDLPFGQEALFALERGPGMPALRVHVWINARTAAERAAAHRVLRDLSFGRRAGDD